jgi:hypothetical protein
LGRSRGSACFPVNQDFAISIIGAMSDMDPGFLARIIDRVVANARVIQEGTEGGCTSGIITLGVSYSSALLP